VLLLTFEKRDTLAATQIAHVQQLQELYAEIGRLTTQVNWSKKLGQQKSNSS
jgi:transposase